METIPPGFVVTATSADNPVVGMRHVQKPIHAIQFHANFFNATNTRDWGIPEGTFTSAAFLNEGANEVSARRIQLGLRYVF